ncbi:MAG: cyclic nucleotide-binding domain-containing protein [Thermodesulfobacteriota bacterium]
MDRSHMEEILGASEFFRGLDLDDIHEISGLCSVETYEPGQSIYLQGDFGERLYVIADGQVVLERSVDLGPRKGTVAIGVLGRGRVFGCWSTLLEEPHNFMSSAHCRKETRLISLKGADLRAMMLGNRNLGFKVLERLCLILRERIQAVYGAMERI